MPVCFAHFRFDPRTRELFRRGRRVRLGEKPARVLETLVKRPGDLVTRAELRRLLWDEHTFVDFDNNLNSAVAALREALGDSAQAPKYIETLPRLGYRFIGVLGHTSAAERTLDAAIAPAVGDLSPDLRSSASHSSRRNPARRPAVAALLLSVALAGATTPLVPRETPGPIPPGVDDARYLLARGHRGDSGRVLRVLASAIAASGAHPAALEAAAEAWLAEALGGPREAFDRAESAARRAVAADASRAGAWRVLASVHLHRDRDAARAAVFASRALAMAPRDPAAHLSAASVAAVRGDYDAALELATTAIRLDPGNWRVRADLAFFLLAAGRYRDALDASRSTLTLEPASTAAIDIQLTAAERLGHWDEARDAALALMTAAGADPADREAVRRAEPRDAVAAYRRWQISMADRLAGPAGWPPMTAAAIYAAAGEAARAVEWLRRAAAAGDPMLVFLPALRDFDPVRDDPAFRAFAASAG